MSESKNAKIASTMLGIEDHGIMTCMLTLDYGGVSQGFGGYDLKYGPYGVKFLREILETVGVSEWEDLPGKYIRVVSDHGKVHRIGHITEDRWFTPESLKDDPENG